jgi:hypothetical protein
MPVDDRIDNIDVPEELTAQVPSLEEADESLQEMDVTGVLIGGKACTILAGGQTVEVEGRKDTDILAIRGGHMQNPTDTEYDLFLPRPDGTFRNRNGFNLSYHIHYVGAQALESGLYLPPPEVIFLTESEMATRRAIDRVVQDIVTVRYGALAENFKQLAKEDVILEFPGDFSWFGHAKFSFPVSVVVKEVEGGGRRTFVSFGEKNRQPNEMPQTAFPTSKDVRTPDADDVALRAFPETPLSVEQIEEIASELINQGYVVEGTRQLIENSPESADDSKFLNSIFDHMNSYPIQCVQAFGVWLETAKTHNFETLLLLQSLSSKFALDNYSAYAAKVDRNVGEIATNLIQNYGPRYLDLAKRLRGFSVSSVLTEAQIIEKHGPQLKAMILKFPQYFTGKDDSNDSDETNPSTLEENFKPSLLLTTWGAEGSFFQKDVPELFQKLGISDEEVMAVLENKDTAKKIFQSYCEMRSDEFRILDKDILGKGITLRALLTTILSPEERLSIMAYSLETSKIRTDYYQDIISEGGFLLEIKVNSYNLNNSFFLTEIAKLCGFTTPEELKEGVFKKTGLNQAKGKVGERKLTGQQLAAVIYFTTKG